MRNRLVPLTLGILLSASGLIRADGLTLPKSSDNWLNTAPLSMESLRGKGAVLWFFEEQ